MSVAGRGLATAVGLGAILITYRLLGVDQMAQVFKKKELKDKYDYVIGNSLMHYSVLTTQRRIRFLVAGGKQGRRVTSPRICAKINTYILLYAIRTIADLDFATVCQFFGAI